MKGRFFSYLHFLVLFAVISAVSLTGEAADKANGGGQGAYEVFPGEFRTMLSPVVADFVERYLYERVNLDEDKDATKRRMEFDEVKCSFPMQVSSFEMLKVADGLSVVIDNAKVYNISWFSNGNNVGEMSFPASFDLLLFTNQIDSYKDLVSRLRARTGGITSVRPNFVGCVPGKSSKAYRRHGPSFYLGHLEANTYLDSISGRPLWTVDYPVESLANLFVYERPVADVVASVELVAYNGDLFNIEIPVCELRTIMEDMGCDAYFGVSEIDEKSGEMEALAIFHNPDLQYLHKLEIKAVTSVLWNQDEVPRILIKMNPYIKLHNLTNLWGEKK